VIGRADIVAVCILVAALSVFTGFSFAHLQQPIAQDDLDYLVAAETYYETGVPKKYNTADRISTYNPELYLQLVVLSFRLFGENEAAARLPGVVSGWLSIILVFLATNSLAHGTRIERLRWASLTSVLYALTPGLIQGVLILSIDNTILIPSVLFLCWTFVQYLVEQKIQWAVLVGLAVVIALWGRVTTPLIVGVALIAYALASGSRAKSRQVGIGALGVGTVLFLVTWYAYCAVLNVPFEGPFTYAWNAFLDKAGSLDLSQIALNGLHFTLWVGLFPVVLVVVALVHRVRVFLTEAKVRPEDAFLLCGLSLGVGYLFIGGAIFGYPKYQTPAIPLLYIFSAVTLSPMRHEFIAAAATQKRIAMALVVIACLIQVFTLGDWIYVIRYQVREALALMPSSYPAVRKEIAQHAVLFCAACGLVFAVARGLSLKTVTLLYTFSLGSCLGISILQATAVYQTGYGYGERGTVEVAAYVRARVPAGSVVIVPQEVNYYLKIPGSTYWHNSLWTDTERLVQFLADRNTSGFVYSIATNTVFQIQAIVGNHAIQEVLQRNYMQQTIGTYRVWTRR